MKKLSFILPLVIIILFSSCITRRYIYAPSAPNITYFNEKGDSKIAAFYSGSGGEAGSNSYRKSNGFDIQGAYAISDNWAFTASWFYRKEKDSEAGGSMFEASKIDYKRSMIELGAGYFVPFNQKKTIAFNIYSGLGTGKFSMNENGTKSGSGYDRFYDVNVIKWYLQPSINFMPGKYFRASFYFKPTLVRYGSYKSDYLPDEYTYFGFDNINNHVLRFFEMGYDLQLGIPKVPWLFIEHSFSAVSRPHYLEVNSLISRGANISIGLSMNFGKMNNK